jgi:hypothetical protein
MKFSTLVLLRRKAIQEYMSAHTGRRIYTIYNKVYPFIDQQLLTGSIFIDLKKALDVSIMIICFKN